MSPSSRQAIHRSAVAAAAATVFLILMIIPDQAISARTASAPDLPVGQKVEKKVEEKVEEKVEVQVAPAKIVERVDKVMVKRGAVNAELQAAQVQALAKQYIRTYQPILEMEMRFLSIAADPPADARREIAVEGAKALKDLAAKMPQGQVQRVIINGRVVNQSLDPRKLIHEAVENTARAKLPAEKFASYKKELDARAHDQREAEVYHLVGTLDKLLILSGEQRQKLVDELRANWDEANYPNIETAVIYDGYYPMINAKYFNTILDDDQKKIWATATKISYASIRTNVNVQNFGPPNRGQESDDPDVKAALAEEVKP